MLNTYFTRLYLNAAQLNLANINSALVLHGQFKNLLDVGCWDGCHTSNFAQACSAVKVYGIEPVPKAAALAAKKHIKVLQITADTTKWPLPNNSINCIISNQVVEHLTDLDKFFSECFRVLAPGGYLITSTNNLSSLHNILSIILGWAPFDLANCSYKFSNLGNPLSSLLHFQDSPGSKPSWTHKCIYTAHWLIDWQSKYGFAHKKTLGAGFYPLPSFIGRLIPSYSAFITSVCQKPQ